MEKNKKKVENFYTNLIENLPFFLCDVNFPAHDYSLYYSSRVNVICRTPELLENTIYSKNNCYFNQLVHFIAMLQSILIPYTYDRKPNQTKP